MKFGRGGGRHHINLIFPSVFVFGCPSTLLYVHLSISLDFHVKPSLEYINLYTGPSIIEVLQFLVIMATTWYCNQIAIYMKYNFMIVFCFMLISH